MVWRKDFGCSRSLNYVYTLFIAVPLHLSSFSNTENRESRSADKTIVTIKGRVSEEKEAPEEKLLEERLFLLRFSQTESPTEETKARNIPRAMPHCEILRDPRRRS